MEVFNVLTTNLFALLSVIGVFAFLVSVITEVTKGVGFLGRIPTDLQVIVLSLVLCFLAYFTYVSYYQMPVKWFYLVGCVIAAFLVAFVTMYGWTKFMDLYNRFKKTGGSGDEK